MAINGIVTTINGIVTTTAPIAAMDTQYLCLAHFTEYDIGNLRYIDYPAAIAILT